MSNAKPAPCPAPPKAVDKPCKSSKLHFVEERYGLFLIGDSKIVGDQKVSEIPSEKPGRNAFRVGLVHL